MHKEGFLRVALPDLLAGVVFAGNPIITYNGTTPYEVRFERQPRTLPDMMALFDGTTGTAPTAHKLRETAPTHIAKASAVARCTRTARTRSTWRGLALDFKPGELVDVYCPSPIRDTSGWVGPAEIVKMNASDMPVTVKCRGHELICPLDNVR